MNRRSFFKLITVGALGTTIDFRIERAEARVGRGQIRRFATGFRVSAEAIQDDKYGLVRTIENDLPVRARYWLGERGYALEQVQTDHSVDFDSGDHTYRCSGRAKPAPGWFNAIRRFNDRLVRGDEGWSEV